MAVFSAINGNVKKNGVDILEVRKWTIQLSGNNAEYASSDTAGWKKRVGGQRDAKITIDLYVDDTTTLQSQFKLSESIAVLELYENGTLKHQGPAFVDDISIEEDIEGGGIVGATVSLSANGAWTDFNPA